MNENINQLLSQNNLTVFFLCLKPTIKIYIYQSKAFSILVTTEMRVWDCETLQSTPSGNTFKQISELTSFFLKKEGQPNVVNDCPGPHTL